MMLAALDSMDWPGLARVATVLALGGGYNTSLVMIGVAVLGFASGIVGTFAVLRKRAMMSDTLSHATLPGIGLAFLAAVALGVEGRSLPVLLAGAGLAGIAGVGAVHVMSRHTRLPEDAAMGAVLSVFFGLGFVLLSYIQTLGTGAEGGIAKFIYGQTAAMSEADAIVIAIVASLVVASVVLLFKEFRLLCFDPDFATAQGWPVGRIDLALMGLVVIVTVIGLQAVGLILVIAMIVIPAAAARFWTEKLARMTIVAGLFGAGSGYVGAALSALMPRFPAGGVIVLVAGAVFLFSLVFAPRRGVLSGFVRHALLSLDIETQHVLRRAYEAGEAARAPGSVAEAVRAVEIDSLSITRSWSPPRRAVVLLSLAARGFVSRRGGEVRLTSDGLDEARRVTRNHRLWEAFLISHADLTPSHVHRSADLVEHVLDPDLVSRLEDELRRGGKLPLTNEPMASAHPC
ncbi:MAG: metal ABC transporter permease [Hyphomicrobiaceae bacterium]|nr:metal ABC transporter permease [Hyphomicrobiaceae bacterium]